MWNSKNSYKFELKYEFIYISIHKFLGFKLKKKVKR